MRSALSLVRAAASQQASSQLQQAALLTSAAEHSLLQPFSPSSSPPQQPHLPLSGPLPSLPALLRGSSLTSPKPRALLVPAGVRAAHFEPTPPGNALDNWASFRAGYSSEKKNSLGPAYYIMIMVFGFYYSLADLHYYPPRVVAIAALLLLTLYTRRSLYHL